MADEEFSFKTGNPADPDEFSVFPLPDSSGLTFSMIGPEQDAIAGFNVPWEQVRLLRNYLNTRLDIQHTYEQMRAHDGDLQQSGG